MQQMHFLQPRSMPTWAVACSLHIRSLDSYLWLLLLGSGFQNSSELQYEVQCTFVCLGLTFPFGTPFLFSKKQSLCVKVTYLLTEKPEKTQSASYHSHLLCFSPGFSEKAQ